MNDFLGILAAVLAVVAVAAVVRYHRRQRARRTAGARTLGWEPVPLPGNLRSRWMREMTLTRIGHSRRIESIFQRPGPLYLFFYRCETGFEHRRNSHRWLAIAATSDARISRATVSKEDWLLAAAQLPGMKRIGVDEGGTSGAAMAVVEDTEHWRGLLSGPLGAWLRKQPAGRSWEFLPGMVVGYEGVGRAEPAIEALSAAMADLLVALTQDASSDAPSESSGSTSPVAFGAG